MGQDGSRGVLMLPHSNGQNKPHLSRGPCYHTERRDGQKPGKQLPGGTENWDAEEDSQSAVESQFEDATIEEEEDEEQVVIESVM